MLSYWRKYKKQKKLNKFYRELKVSDKLCFDVGANEGIRTEALLNCKSKVIAFEPQPECLQQLNKKYKNNSNLIIAPFALSGNDGKASFFICEEYSDCSTLSEEFKENYGNYSKLNYKRQIQVDCLTIETAIKKYGQPYYIKLDTEGNDFEILRNLKSEIPVISFEYNFLLKHHAIAIIEKMQSLYSFNINYIHYENYEFRNSEKIEPQIFLNNLEKYFPENILTGEIFMFADSLI